MNNNLEYRMYGFVPYNLSEIQKGIQFGHAVVEYQQLCRDIPKLEKIYNKWAIHDKTFTILNDGTTNNNFEREGTLNNIKDELTNMLIPSASFYEPDLGDQLTAVVFLLDERIYNKEKYVIPSRLENIEFFEWNYDKDQYMLKYFNREPFLVDDGLLNGLERELVFMGGIVNFNLRRFLSNYKLA